jgi:hypothetical protein
MNRRSTALLIAIAMLLASCGPSRTIPTLPAAPASTALASAAATPATTQTPGPVATPTALLPPSAPGNFTATAKHVPCPSIEETCVQTDFAWASTSGPGTRFKIYTQSTGEGPETCLDVQSTAVMLLETAADAVTARDLQELSVGGGQVCYWITAVSAAGESQQVPVQGQ